MKNLKENKNMDKFYVIGHLEEWYKNNMLPDEADTYSDRLIDYNGINFREDCFYNKSSIHCSRTLKDATKYATFKETYHEIINSFNNDENDCDFIILVEKVNTINDIPLHDKYMVSNVYIVHNNYKSEDIFGLVEDLNLHDYLAHEVTEIKAYNEES